MPLTWLRCPVNGVETPLAECLDCALHYRTRYSADGTALGHCHHPYPYLKMLCGDEAHRKLAGFSVTTMAPCLRQSWLKKTLGYGVDPDRLMAASKGTAWHHELELHNRPDALCEVRLGFALPSGRIVTGQVDCYVPDPAYLIPGLPEGPGSPGGRLEDHKTKDKDKSRPQYHDQGYVLQQNAYRVFIEQGCTVIDPGTSELKEGQYIQGPVAYMVLYYSEHKTGGSAVTLPRLPDDQVIAYLETCWDHWEVARDVIPPRYDIPSDRHPFCSVYCPVRGACEQVTRERGGDDPPDHPLRLLQIPRRVS